MILCSELNFTLHDALHCAFDDAITLCNVLNKRKSDEKRIWRLDMYTFACLVNAKDEDRKKILKELQREENKQLTPEQEREALLNLKNALK